MKKLKSLLFIVIFTASVTGVAFSLSSVKDYLAKPKQQDGLNVYIMCEPVDEYYKLGQVGSGTNTQLKYMLNTIVKNVKTQYPDADGVIVDTEKNIGYAINFKQ